MTILGRTIIETTGFDGGPGVNVVHWSAGVGPGPTDPDGVDEFHETLITTWLAYQAIMPADVRVEILADVAYFDASDGVILGVTTDPASPRFFQGTSVNNQLSRATQLVCRYRTEEFVNGRRLQGRSFLGPIGSPALDGSGQVAASVVSNASANFAGLISGLGGKLAVWHRPTTPTGTDGSYGDVTSVQINPVPGTLRSRKT